ncbi:hypothetical protein Bp8pC_188 [Bacillus phage Bp8p-C]|uniref:Uncharacterized protein n=2 Tax=Agatevirus Bp8pC TaxID=1910937 RepID=A0A0A0PJE4_9CAUD|nr:hypothetical protein AXJ20_gp160 [Bacillus phage Bp8p-C]YP_009784488.1 hypothetical protein QLX39_gp160 [Bacillus phage Bp8p-T]AHJ87618.1 hypothetical protein Bp8pC_188 [Bacillus phage Bp8p-C]AHJ87829.1 hypothetical protein Bp8pT_188 [Bacillus phage Bp8p-T]
MLLNVQIQFSEYDNDWEVNVWDREEGERVEYLERIFPTEKDASDYVDSLAADKQYDIIHID